MKALQRLRDPKRLRDQKGGVGYVLLWLIGLPLPIVVVLYLLFH